MTDDSSLTPDEVDDAVIASIGELLNIASIAAELQNTDEAAEEIYVMCDLVAAYFGIARSTYETIENSDGSVTTRLLDTGELAGDVPDSSQRAPIAGSIQTRGKLKYRVVDKDSAPDLDDLADHDEEGEQ